MSSKAGRRKFFSRCACCEPGAAPASPARRTFLASGAAALGLGAATAFQRALPATAQTPAKTRIDVHHHFIPKFHIDSMMAPGRRTGAPPPPWSPSLSLEDMDKSGIATSILSIAQPGIWYGNNLDESRNAGPRSQRIRRQAGQRSSRPLRPLRLHRAPGRRRQPEGDRIRLRYAQGRRHRAADELSGQVSRRPIVRAGLRGAQPAQGRRLCPPDHAGLLPRPRPRHPARLDRIRHGFDAHDRARRVQRHRGQIPGHPLDLVALGRHAAVSDRPLHPPRRGTQAGASAQRPDAGVQEVLLRAGPGQYAGPDRGAAQDGRHLAGDVRHRLSVPRPAPRSMPASRTTASPRPTSPRSSAATR